MVEPRSFPAIRCHLGDWTYFSTVMTFGDLATRIQQADEIHSHQGLQEMIQRELGKRVNDIATYLETRPERFFNAIVVGVYDGSPDWLPIDIEDIDEIRPLNLAERARESVGILQLSGGEKLFAVDGQHRVEGIKIALGNVPQLEEEELTVLFVGHRQTPEGTARTRRLFTTLNKYAKPVTRSEIIALDEDDTFAIITRMLVNQYDGLSKTSKEGKRLLELVKIKGPQIPSTNQYCITTIQMLYKLVRILAVGSGNKTRERGLKRSSPSFDIVESMYTDHVAFWEGLRKHVEPMGIALGSNPSERLAGRYRSKLGGHVLFRPVGQEAFAQALRTLLDRAYPLDEGLSALAQIQLSLNEPPWRDVMWDPSQNTMNRTNVDLAASLMLFMIGQPPVSINFDLEEAYQAAAGDQSIPLDQMPKGYPMK